MATRHLVIQTTLRRTVHRQYQYQHHQIRTFFAPPPQSLTATRLLPYPRNVIYSIISDVGAYQTYLPYCRQSVVTKISSAAPNGQTYPEEAKLSIGLTDDMSEEFWSRVYCVPDSVVEAVSGTAETTLAAGDITHHSPRPRRGQGREDRSREGKVMTSLLTKWTLRSFPYKPAPTSALRPETVHNNLEETSELPGQENTEVSLSIDFQFANPLYAAMGQVAVPKAAEKMIEAFEKRVKAAMRGPGRAQAGGI